MADVECSQSRKKAARVEYRAARADAHAASKALRRCLGRRSTVRVIAGAAERAKLAAARLYTAAACILSPP